MGIIFHLIIIFIFLLPYSPIARTTGRVLVGKSLTAGSEDSPWLSASGDFAFGFQQLQDKELFLLSIWYDKIPQKTIVWYADKNGDNPAPMGSQVELNAERGLVLKGPQGNEIWRSNISPGGVAYGVMNDTGNFELANSSSVKLWDSFSNPTDTLLPTQTMETEGELFSRRSETNFSKGRFRFRFQDNGNLVLNTVNLPSTISYAEYYASGTDDANKSLNGSQVIFNESAYMYVLRRNGQRFNLTTGRPVSVSEFYHRAVLNFDGVFAQYSYPKKFSGNGSWSPVWYTPDNICLSPAGDQGSGPCGYNSVCSLKSDGRPNCTCPQKYSLIDKSDDNGDCKPDFELSCKEEKQSSAEDLYDFVTLTNTDFLFSDYEHLDPYDEKECRESCLHDCLCAVAVSGENGCWKKRIPVSNGRENGTVNRKAFLKYRKVNYPLKGDIRKHDGILVTAAVLLGSSVFVNIILIAAFLFGFFFIYKRQPRRAPLGESTMETNLRCFTYKELAEATNNFNEEVGRGSFGIVYKGEILRGLTNIVAVKKLDGIFQDGEQEFKTEVVVIGQTHHKNLVRLLGFCDEGDHRLLVYEFFSNGTLANFVFGESKPCWNLRTHIAFGIAKGLLYLHEECSTQIIHCDIKPQNILLDDFYNARISDFGLAKLLMANQSKTKTAIRGTKGYVAPEWYRSSPITAKVDVYSFGVVLLEIIACRKGFDAEMGEESAILTDWVYDCYRCGRLDTLVKDEKDAMDDINQLERFVMVAIWCIQEDPSVRPIMRKVSQMLEGVVEVPVPPNPSPFTGSVN